MRCNPLAMATLTAAMLFGSDLSFVKAQDATILPTGPQDAEISTGIGYIDRANAFLRWGYYDIGGPNYHAIVSVGMHTLPSITPAEVQSAKLRLSRTDNNFTGGTDQYNLTLVARHIDAADDTQATSADQGSAPLDPIGTYRSPGPYTPDSSRFVEFDVTAMVQADLTAGRATFAWRVEPESLPAYAGGGHKQSYFPSVDSTDAGFGNNKSGKLILRIGVPPEVCDNGIDDDGDAFIDCADPECADFPGEPCRETICDDGIDGDNDGMTDCADLDCSDSPACPEICDNGTDDDADGAVDCEDSECQNNPVCPESLCADGLDNDGDQAIDCVDSDCFGATGCTNENVCDDGADNDDDCLIDGSDPDCVLGFVVVPTGPQDGEMSSGISYLDRTNTILRWGYYDTGGPNYHAIVSVGMHALPGIQAADVGKATLRLSRADVDYTGGGSHFDLTLVANHIDAVDDAQVTSADQASPALDLIGIYRPPGPGSSSTIRFIEFDVTALVQSDLLAGRPTFAWRVEPESLPAYAGGSHKQAYFPSIEGEAAFGQNKSGRLTIQLLGQFEANCTDDIDNDGDGATDCDDAECYSTPACPLEVCADGVDNDGDGQIDCSDVDCRFDSCCPPPVEICDNGVDDDEDEQVDCNDIDCRCAPNCGPPPAEVCDNDIDDDCDGDSDCVDADCLNHPVCLNCHDPFADTDEDGDVDMYDFAAWQRCVAGGDAEVLSECACFDRLGDGDVDSEDFDAFAHCARGSGVPADPSCDGGI